jgi:DhnA family fructose-bisphosphate aldolase class Ia
LENLSEQYKHTLADYSFRVEDFFPRKLFDLITETRVHNPQVMAEAANARRRREKLTQDGKLTILACDHPARMVTSIGENPVAIANRYEFLGRITRILMSQEFDGVMGTPDIIEELLIVDHLIKDKGGRGLLSEKVILGCMNRGGLSGASFELDDRYTAFTAESIQNMRLDGAKLMFRLDLENPDAGKTIYYTSQAINECNRRGIPVFLEALPVEKREGKYGTKKSTELVVKLIGVATGLGDSSRNLWLKIPYCENYQQVANATTCPILVLGGEALGDPTYIYGAINGRENDLDPPHLIYLPEQPLDEEKFLADVDEVVRDLGRAVIVAAEGLRNRDGGFLSMRADQLYTDKFGHPQPGGVANYLCNLVSSRLNLKARFDKPRTIQRVSMVCASEVDLEEAYLVGKIAVREAVDGTTGYMVTLQRRSSPEYECETGLVRGGRKAYPRNLSRRIGTLSRVVS